MNFEASKTLLDRIANIYPDLLARPVRVTVPQPAA
jgi:hypothetical protein